MPLSNTMTNKQIREALYRDLHGETVISRNGTVTVTKYIGNFSTGELAPFASAVKDELRSLGVDMDIIYTDTVLAGADRHVRGPSGYWNLMVVLKPTTSGDICPR